MLIHMLVHMLIHTHTCSYILMHANMQVKLWMVDRPTFSYASLILHQVTSYKQNFTYGGMLIYILIYTHAYSYIHIHTHTYSYICR